MPATVTCDPLRISCVFSDGSQAVFTLGNPPCPRLARDLLDGLARLIHPHGTVDAAGTAEGYVRGLKLMTRALAGRGFTGGAGQLTRAMTAEYLMGAGPAWEGYARGLLRGLAAAGEGRLAPAVSELAAGRAFNVSGGRRPLDPYSETEWTRLITACQRVIDDAYARHKEGLRAAGQGTDPREGGWSLGNTCWLLARTGPCGKAAAAAHLGVPAGTLPGGGVFPRARQMLFPHTEEVIAYQLLFGAYSGIVPDGVAGLRAGDIDWAGDAAILLSYIKGRTGPESVNLPLRAVRLLEQWLSHSALLRQFLPEGQRDQLWARLPTRDKVEAVTGRINTGPVIGWAARHQVTADNGRVLKIHRHRIRTTHHAMRDRRAWTGSTRATIDPNHSPQVEGDHYLTAATPEQRHHVDTLIEEAQHDLVRRAHPPAVIGGHDAAALARDFPHLVSGLGLPAGGIVLAELTGGQRDVFAAACADQLSGLHGPPGKPCPARPWVCLACPLAVFAPRHAPNLLRLRAFFARQWQAMPSAQFMAVFGLYARRVDEVLERFAPAVVDAAAGYVAGDDGELPLRPEERTR
jgi:hypothetical protein